MVRNAIIFATLVMLLFCVAPASAQQTSIADGPTVTAKPADSLPIRIPDLTKRENVGSTLQLVVLLTVLSLAPAILLMVTSFARIIIVLSLLRQALGAQQLPPNQVLVGLSLFMTFLIMTPTWQRVNNEAVQPYMNGQLDAKSALKSGIGPVREVMAKQTERAG